MSEIRLILVEKNLTTSGHIPSSSISAIMWAISAGATDNTTLWQKVAALDPGLENHYQSNADEFPILEGYDDGLLVINWDYRCIESFQVYQPLKFTGTVTPHNGRFLETDKDEIEYQITSNWTIIDHHFEESRH